MKRKTFIILAAILSAILLSSCNVQQPNCSSPSEFERVENASEFETIEYIGNESEFETIEYIGDGYIRVSNNDGKYGILKNGGEVVIEPQYDWISSVLSENGYRLFRQNDLYGYLNENGNVVIEPQFEDANSFRSDGTALIRIGLTFYLIDETGGIVGLAD